MYFAYGSNLLAQRIHINIPSAIRKEIGKLEASFKIQKAGKDILHYQVMINFQCMKLEKRDTCVCLIRKYMNFILKLAWCCVFSVYIYCSLKINMLVINIYLKCN